MIYILSAILYIISIFIIYGLLDLRRDEWMFAEIVLDDRSNWIIILLWPFSIVLYGLFVSLLALGDWVIDWFNSRKYKNKK